MVKRFIIIVLAICIAALLQADSASALSISFTNYTYIDFGEMDSGLSGVEGMAHGSVKNDIPPKGLDITCSTGGTAGWTLKIKTLRPFTHKDNPSYVIPNTYFKWYGIKTSNTTNTSLYKTPPKDLTSYGETIYTGIAGETKTTITIKFELTVPPDLPAGEFNVEDQIVFTLTE